MVCLGLEEQRENCSPPVRKLKKASLRLLTPLGTRDTLVKLSNPDFLVGHTGM